MLANALFFCMGGIAGSHIDVERFGGDRSRLRTFFGRFSFWWEGIFWRFFGDASSPIRELRWSLVALVRLRGEDMLFSRRV